MPHVFDASSARPTLQWSLTTLSGPDARDFLHRLTTVHVNGLGVGQGAAGCFLTAQGKIRAFFTLWHTESDRFMFEFDAGATGHWKQELLAAIDQYTFAEKQQLADITALESRWILADAGEERAVLAALGAPELKSGQTVAVDEEIRLCHHGVVDFGRAWITSWGRPARLAQWLERALPGAAIASNELLEQWRIQAMRPRVDTEITSTTIPLEAGLLDALAQGKGCYPGQEVIERIASLGAPARRLALIEVRDSSGHSAPPAPGEAIFNLADPPAEVGQLTSIAASNEGRGFSALAYVRKIHAKEGLEVRIGSAGALGSITRVAPYA